MQHELPKGQAGGKLPGKKSNNRALGVTIIFVPCVMFLNTYGRSSWMGLPGGHLQSILEHLQFEKLQSICFKSGPVGKKQKQLNRPCMCELNGWIEWFGNSLDDIIAYQQASRQLQVIQSSRVSCKMHMDEMFQLGMQSSTWAHLLLQLAVRNIVLFLAVYCSEDLLSSWTQTSHGVAHDWWHMAIVRRGVDKYWPQAQVRH